MRCGWRAGMRHYSMDAHLVSPGRLRDEGSEYSQRIRASGELSIILGNIPLEKNDVVINTCRNKYGVFIVEKLDSVMFDD